MDSENSGSRDKKRSRPMPLMFWFSGAVLAGGLMTFAMLSFKKGEIITDLNLKLTETETNHNLEKNELNGKLAKSAAAYNELTVQHGASIASLTAEQSRNKKLAELNASYIIRESELNKELSFWQDSASSLNNAYSGLLAENSILRSTIEDLQARLAGYEKESQDQTDKSGYYMDQIERMRADSLAMAAYKDSIIQENVSGFFNNTNLSGGYGLGNVSIPYSKYYYGLHTINGYRINRHFMTGIGLGIQSYNDGGLMSPVFLDLRYTVGRKNFLPYLFADGGLLLNYDNINVPSLFINPGLGFIQKIGGHFSLNMGAGYYMQKESGRHSFVNVNMGIVYRKK